jgi:nucleoside-diphosphate-sugar epimerase
VASSSGIWADTVCEQVDAGTPARLDSPRTRRLAEIEGAWSAAGLDSVAVRLAGLWGPGRIVGRDTVLAGRPLPGAADAWLNLVHAEDAATALCAAGRLAEPPAVLLISDGRPLRRADYYAALATALGVAAPVFDGTTPPRGNHARRCDSRDSWQRLGVAPRHDDIVAGLAALLADGGGAG